MHLSLKGSMDRQPLTDRLGDKLLAEYGGAAAAYSLRALNGNGDKVVRVRRSSDNAEKDFTASQLSTGEMTNWVNSQIVPPLDIGVETSDGRPSVPDGGTSIGTPAAAYSLRSLGEGQADDIVPSGDTVTPAAGAYVVQVRRSSDDNVKSFTASEMGAALEDWVNEDYTAYTQTGESTIPTGSNLYVSLPSYSVINTIGHTFRISFKLKRNTGGSGTTGLVSLRNTSIWNYTTIEKSSNLDEAANRFQINTSTEAYQTYSLTVTTNEGSSQSALRFQTYDSDDSYTVKDFNIEVIESNGYVETWYDQSGSDNHATQTTNANQPKIVDAGTYLGEIDFDGVNHGLEFDESAVITNMDDFSSFTVAKSDTTSGTKTALSVSDDSPNASRWYSPILIGGNFTFGYGTSATAVSLGTADTNEHLFSSIAGSTIAEAWKDGTSGGSVSSVTTAPSPVSGINLGGSNDALLWDGSIKEIIMYDSDQSANREALEANIGEYYGISGIPAYDNTVDGFVETWYDQSGNGNDATQTVAASQPKIVDAGTYLGEIDFDGSDDHLDFTGIATTDVSVFSVVDLDVTNSQERILSAQSGFSQGFAINNATTGFFRGGGGTASTPALNTTFSTNTPTLYSLIRASGTGTFSTNNTASASFTNTDVFTPASIAGVVSPMDGSAKEIILYDSDQSANRTAIEANINNHYSIY